MYKEYRKFSGDKTKEDSWFINLTREKKKLIVKLPQWMKFDNRLKIIHKFIPKGSLILDMGCGSGDWVNLLVKNHYNSIGVDFSKRLIELSQSKYPKYKFICADIRDSGLAQSTADALISWGVIEHDEAGIKASIMEFHRLLKPGGIAIVTIPYDNLEARKFSQYLFKDSNGEFFQYYLNENDLKDNLFNKFNIIEWGATGITAFGKIWPNLYLFLQDKIILLRFMNILSTLIIRSSRYKLMAYFVLEKK